MCTGDLGCTRQHHRTLYYVHSRTSHIEKFKSGQSSVEISVHRDKTPKYCFAFLILAKGVFEVRLDLES